MRRVGTLLLLMATCASRLAAQPPVTMQPLAQQPVVHIVWPLPTDTARPAEDWIVPDAVAVTFGQNAPSIAAHGPVVRLASATSTTVRKRGMRLMGAFTVRATFQRLGDAPSEYGLTLGGDTAPVAFLLRSDGSAGIQRAGVVTWTSITGLRAATAEGPAADVIEVRVTETSAELIVNGQRVVASPIAAGELDGAPGVHVGGGADVVVAAFTVEGPPSLFFPSRK